jgi:hypothetical protein
MNDTTERTGEVNYYKTRKAIHTFVAAGVPYTTLNAYLELIAEELQIDAEKLKDVSFGVLDKLMAEYDRKAAGGAR